MIIVIPAIGVIIQQVVQAVAVGAVIGAVTGAGAGAVVEVVAGVQEHAEINREVVDDAASGALNGAANGALFGGAFGPVALVAGPAMTVAGNVAGHAVGTIDDVARPILTGLGGSASTTAISVGRTISAPYRIGRAAWHARFYKSMPKAACSGGCIYVMDDATRGASKIGVTTNPARRIVDVQRNVGSELQYVGIMPIDDAFAAEAALHRQFASQRAYQMPGREWFGLSPLDKAYVLGS